MKVAICILLFYSLAWVSIAANLSKPDKMLLAAAEQGDITSAKQAVESGANVNCRDKHSWAPLDWAALKGQAAMAKWLIDHGAEVDFPDAVDGVTPLMRAAGAGDCLTLVLLLQHNVAMNRLSRKGLTALMIAAYAGHLNVAKLLVKRGADIGIVGYQGESARTLALKGVSKMVNRPYPYLLSGTESRRKEVADYLHLMSIGKMLAKIKKSDYDAMISVDYKILATTDELTLLSWELTVWSGLEMPLSVIPTIQFLDEDDIVLTECSAPMMLLEPHQEKKVSGTVIIRNSLVDRIASATADWVRME